MKTPVVPKVLFSTCLLLLSSNLIALSARAAESPFPDKSLEAAIRGVLRHETKTDLTDEMLLNVYVLEAPGKEIRDLTGLEKCKNLALLKLSKNKVVDLKPLKDLGNIQSLDLDDNAIVDLTSLAGLTKLQYLKLSNNKIADLKPLDKADQPQGNWTWAQTR